MAIGSNPMDYAERLRKESLKGQDYLNNEMVVELLGRVASGHCLLIIN